LENMLLAELTPYSSPKSYEQISLNNQQRLLSLARDGHPKALLSFVRRIGNSLANSLVCYPTEKIVSRVLAVEKLKVKEWYWDIQIPNTNNYFSEGCIHHNSAKSILAAHLGIGHCLQYSRARLVIARRAMPDLRDTIYTKICEHLEGATLADGTELKEGKHYFLRDTTCSVTFWNKSEIIAKSWADGNYKKVGSIEASAAIVEELTENDEGDEMALRFLRMRVGRLPHVPRSWIVYCTNPDGTRHFAYDYFDIGKRMAGQKANLPKTRHVYFSSTKDNKFLAPWYIKQLEADLDPKLALRMIHGLWVDIESDKVYHSYGEHNYRDYDYVIDPFLPVNLCHDFNIGAGKPMSMCLSQYDEKKDEFHFFADVVVDGADTEKIMEEIAARGHLDYDVPEYMIYGDQTGEARHPAAKKSNYDIIVSFLANYRSKTGHRVEFSRHLPKANPPIRERHNIVNGYCKNALGKTRLYVYRGAKVLDKGMRLTELKKGGQYIEDDSKPYQHVTTALGYHVHRVWKRKQSTSGLRQEKIR
jgi:hypothetical protein